MEALVPPYNPDDTIPGFTIRLGDILSADCWNRMPAVIVWGEEDITRRRNRYPETEEEYELYGTNLPDTIPIKRDIEIGCKLYQQLARLGLPVEFEECTGCPLYTPPTES